MKPRLIVALLFLSSFGIHAVSQPIHVPADQPSIQQGIDAAVSGDTIIVAEGTYFENINFNGKAITLASQFILDGDTSHISKTIIDGSQASNPLAASVVTIKNVTSNNSVLAGLTIAHGAGSRFYYYGYAMTGGGGIFLQGCGATIVNNVIENNSVNSAVGGVLISPGEADTVKITRNTIRNNEVRAQGTAAGGGIWVMGAKESVIHIHDNKISGNKVFVKADYKAIGGGISIETDYSFGADIQIFNNIIDRNELHCQASHGGGIFVNYQKNTSDPITEAQVKIYNNIISSNYSEESGGGIAVWRGASAIGKERPEDPIIVNNTIVDNIAVNGAGLWNYDNSTVLFNNILWNDLSAENSREIFNDEIYYSDGWTVKRQNDGDIFAINNLISDGWPGPGNIDADPLFESDSYRLADGSPCIGGGIDSIKIEDIWYYAPESDLLENSRPNVSYDMQIDIGAMESPHAFTPEYSGSGITNVPGDATTIQDGIDSASENDTVLVAPGLYYENINFKGKAITMASHFIMDGDTSHISKTEINGSQATDPEKASVVTITDVGNSKSLLAGFTISGGSGSSFIRGNSEGIAGGGIVIDGCGATIRNNIVESNTVQSTWAAIGGILVRPGEADTVIVMNNTVRNNEVRSELISAAGGMWIQGAKSSVIHVHDNLISENKVFVEAIYKAIGGGISIETDYSYGADIQIFNNNIIKNELHCQSSHGGGIYVVYNPYTPLTMTSTQVRIFNNIIMDNYSEDVGGGIGVWNMVYPQTLQNTPVDPVIINNTIVNNSASEGSGLFNYDAKTLFVNNILWNDLSIEGSGEIYNDNINYPDWGWNKDKNDGVLLIQYNNIQGDWEGLGNISADPVFETDSYSLAIDSPGIGNGIASIEIDGNWYDAPNMDFYGNPRPNPIDPFVDIGAVESPFVVVYVPTGIDGYTPIDITIYPNPVNKLLTIETSISDHYYFEITCLNGQGLLSIDMYGTTHQIDISDFREGIYFITIRSKDFVTTRKIIKM